VGEETVKEGTGKEVSGMKDLFKGRIVTREKIFLAGFFFVYALILLASDPEWLMWAGPIALGAFPVEAAPATPFSAVPLESLQWASYLTLPGLLALLILAKLRGDAHGIRAEEAPRSPAEDRHEPARGMPEHRKAA
jgi:hypothetical protein